MLATTSVCSHTFLPQLIGSDWVIDCGANRGNFSAWVSSHTRARVIAYEPDPRLFERLPQHERVIYYNLALAAAEGEVCLFLGDKSCSSLLYAESTHAETAKVRAVELGRHVMSCGVDKIGLLKLDIEGAELDVLGHLSPSFFNRVKQITCEFHDFKDQASLPRVRQVIGHLEAQGFYAINFSQHNHGDVLFLNRRYVAMGFSEKLNLHAVKYARGAFRLAQRSARRCLRVSLSRSSHEADSA